MYKKLRKFWVSTFDVFVQLPDKMADIRLFHVHRSNVARSQLHSKVDHSNYQSIVPYIRMFHCQCNAFFLILAQIFVPIWEKKNDDVNTQVSMRNWNLRIKKAFALKYEANVCTWTAFRYDSSECGWLWCPFQAVWIHDFQSKC